MPRNSSGVYSLPSVYLAVADTDIVPDQHNTPLEDIAAEITKSVATDGRTPMTGELRLSGDPTVPLGAVPKQYADRPRATTTVALTSSNVTLTDAQCAVGRLLLTGALTASVSVTLPSTSLGEWVVDNQTSGAYSVTIASAGAGTSLTAQQGTRTPIWHDGTNIRGSADGPAGVNTVTPANITHGAWVTIASAATVDLGGARDASNRPTRNVVISGSTSITSFGSTGAPDYVPFVVRFSGALTLVHNISAIILPTQASLTTAAGDVALVVWEGTAWRVISYCRGDGTPLGAAKAPAGYLSGLVLSYASTTTFTVGAGVACSEDGSAATMALAAAMTKSLSAWAVGTAGGSLDTGAIAAGKTYHVHLIQRASDGLVDILISLSATAPTMPTAGGTWTARRRIGALLTNASSQIVPFTQSGDETLLLTPVIDVSVTTQGATAVMYPLSVPTGVRVRAIISAYMDARATNNIGLLITSPDASDVAAGANSGTPTLPFNAGNAGTSPLIVALMVRTDTSGQVRARASGANSNLFQIHTFGWIDMRGQ